ncbi:hypothetical protein GBAG_4191 [Buttiauxella agrestis ATCC 33320]|uniref:Uncharacterized protein n=1 Tax=Buttiauxella agrestis ATCC 33320 TaxID=1006004 RepID=A0A085FZQ4_9ENTR|nr:hypothetical protein GBAG_4191 [Buttiauxella agrestis ATCC 33320]
MFIAKKLPSVFFFAKSTVKAAEHGIFAVLSIRKVDLVAY